MDYLVAEGFKEAAEKFKLEAGIEISRLNNDALSETNEQLDQRIEIRAAIEDGNISTALWLINQHYPELIDHNRCLFFKLQVSDCELLFVYILTFYCVCLSVFRHCDLHNLIHFDTLSSLTLH